MDANEQAEAVTSYWAAFYADRHCTLCANHGVIDSRGLLTSAGVLVGRINYCICPNGQALRAARAVPALVAQHILREV